MHPEPKFNGVSVPDQSGLSGVQDPNSSATDHHTPTENVDQHEPAKPWLLDPTPGIRGQGNLPSKPHEPDVPNPMPHPPGDEQPSGDPRIPEEAPPQTPPAPVQDPQRKAA